MQNKFSVIMRRVSVVYLFRGRGLWFGWMQVLLSGCTRMRTIVPWHYVCVYTVVEELHLACASISTDQQNVRGHSPALVPYKAQHGWMPPLTWPDRRTPVEWLDLVGLVPLFFLRHLHTLCWYSCSRTLITSVTVLVLVQPVVVACLILSPPCVCVSRLM